MNKMLRTALVLGFACASPLLITPACAQSVYGSIFGTVTDKSGAAIPGASVTVTDESKGTVVSVASNGSGDYSVPHLIPDVYDIKVTAKGFKTFEAKGVSVEADAAPRIDPTLDVGGSETTIEVSADQEPTLKTDRADVATIFDQQQVQSLPVGDQNFTNLQLLLPGAQLLGWSHAADENPQGSKQIQVDGQAFGGTAFELDGTDNQDPILGIIVINPAMDAVTETKITTQNYDAELGKAVSAVVTAQTRSGTNTFHGSLYDFRTGNANYARDPYSEAPGTIPPGLKNRMGGSVGGPILKDKFFFFANYEGQRQKVGTSATDTLPTNLLTETALGKRVGPGFDGHNTVPGADFSEYEKQLGASGIVYDNSTGTPTPFPDNVIPASMLSQQALNLLGYLEPYTSGIGLGSSGALNGLDTNFHASGTGLFNSDQWTERLDYTINEKMHAFERFSRFTDTLSGAVAFGAAGGPGFGIGGYGGNSNGANDSLASGMDIAINPTLLTDFRLGYYRYNVIDSKHDQDTNFATTLGIPGINLGPAGSFTAGSPGFFLDKVPGGNTQPLYGDGLNVNRCNCPLTEREDQFQIVNNWTKIIGNNSIKVGADLRYGRNLRVPSDVDRAGLLAFGNDATSDQSSATQGGIGFATFLLGLPSNIRTNGITQSAYGRYVSTSTNAKEFQKRTFFYGQDTWRATHNLTLNLGLRWELYFPETVNAAQNGGLLNLNDGYIHVAGVGGIPSDMGWGITMWKQLEPRVGIAYQIRTGYGRSFDTGVFGSVFGHTVTQNLPVLASQQVNSPTTVTAPFTLAQGPPAPGADVFPPVPSNGLLPNPGYSVDTKARQNPLTFPSIDAWNLSLQRAITPTLTLTMAYVGNKGTHTLGDGDSNNTNPNEAAINLPGQYSVTGQSLHFDPKGPNGTNPTTGAAQPLPAGYSGGVSNQLMLQRYYGGSLPACKDSNYHTPTNEVNVVAGMCGWTSAIQFNGDNQNTHFNAMQVTLAQTFSKGLAITGNYQWASAFDEASGFFTWDPRATYGRDSNVRKQQLTAYGSYDLPFGKGKQYGAGVNRVTDLLIGGYQLSSVVNWAGGLPFSLGYNEAGTNLPGSAPNYPSARGGRMLTSLSSFQPGTNGVGQRTFYQAQTTDLITDPGTGIFSNPGLDNIGNVGRDTYMGPHFFGTDMAVTKAFTIWESVVAKFRMDAFNAFNHITAGNPSGNIESLGTITSEGGGCGPGNDCGPRQLEFSLRLQF